MNLRDFERKHTNRDFVVIACGPSVRGDWDIPTGCISIGVNDCERWIQASPDYLVVSDLSWRFKDDEKYRRARNIICESADIRLNAIRQTRATHVFVPNGRVESWEGILHDEQIVRWHFAKSEARPDACDGHRIGYSKTSVYPACLLAEYMGARRIGIIGLDLFGHPNLDWRLDVVNDHMSRLTAALSDRGVQLYNLSLNSGLPIEAMPKLTTEEFLHA